MYVALKIKLQNRMIILCAHAHHVRSVQHHQLCKMHCGPKSREATVAMVT